MISERLKHCISVGSVEGLFPMLHSWSEEELNSLLKDIEQFSEEAQTKLDKAYEELFTKPEFFFNKQLANRLDTTHQDAKFEVMAILSEISSVAYYFLEEHKRAKSGIN